MAGSREDRIVNNLEDLEEGDGEETEPGQAVGPQEEEEPSSEAERVRVAETGTDDGTGPRRHQEPDDVATADAPSRPSGHMTNIVVIHPSQTRFTCPDTACRLTYPTHASLVRHVGVSHKGITLNISFKCALCDYTHA